MLAQQQEDLQRDVVRKEVELLDLKANQRAVEAQLEAARTQHMAAEIATQNKKLVLDALDRTLPDPEEVVRHDDLRRDLLAVLRRIAAVMSSHAGGAARACLGPGVDPELSDAIRTRLLAPRRAALLEVLRRAAVRGEVRPEAVTERMAELGPTLLHGELLHRGRIDDAAIVAIVDEVLMPLLQARG